MAAEQQPQMVPTGGQGPHSTPNPTPSTGAAAVGGDPSGSSGAAPLAGSHGGPAA